MFGRKFERTSSFSSKESMEDLLIQQYKDSIQSDNNKTKRTKTRSTSVQSPYLQSVAPEDASLFQKTSRNRPTSAYPSSRRKVNILDIAVASLENNHNSSSDNSDDDNYSSTFDDSSTDDEKQEPTMADKENKSGEKSKPQPATEQVKKFDPQDFDSSNNTSKSIFERRNFTITCNAYKNGSLDMSVRIASPTIKQVLEDATTKLGLNTAARRVFLADGTEAFRPLDIPKGADVFISKGEAFRDPYRALKNSHELSSSSLWSMQGVSLPPRRKVKPPRSKRLNELVGKHTLRVVVFSNGEGSRSHEVPFGIPTHYERKANNRQRNAPQNDNRQSGRLTQEEALERKHAVSYNKFLDGCTLILTLNTSAKILFDWKGDVVTHISQVEKMDRQITEFVMHGPLWVSRGEGFSPKGSKLYLEGVITDLRGRLHGAKQCKRDLDFLEDHQFNNISNPSILDLSEDAVYGVKEKVVKDIDEFKAMLKKYKARWKIVKTMTDDQQSAGAAYTMKNIKEIEGDDRLLGEHGLRLRVYDNGNDTSYQDVYLNMRVIRRGTKDLELMKARFLEALTVWHKPVDPAGPARSSLVRRLFYKDGVEIFNVLDIKNEAEVWLSYGDNFKPFLKPALTLKMDRAAAVMEVEGSTEICKVYGETLSLDDLPQDAERFARWETSEGFPSAYRCPMLSDLSSPVRFEAERSIKDRGLPSTDHYVHHKKDPSLVLRPSVQVDQKMTKKEMWPKEAQTWVFNQSGKIYSRAFPSLSLSVNYENPVAVHYKDGTTAEGFSVSLKKKNTSDEKWGFSAEGNIYAVQGVTQLVLTYLESGLVHDVKDQKLIADQSEVSASQLTPAAQFDSHEPVTTLAVLDKFKGQSSRSATQRWAIKQESLTNPCQWKHTKVSNPEWRKLAYSWPVLPDGNWNTKHKWPMEGMLLPNAPSLTSGRANSDESPVKVRVLKNGEQNRNLFTYVVLPDLTNAKVKNAQNLQQLVDLEMALVLEKITILLGLTFAARRLFDAKGKEVFSLKTLKRDQIVYASTGETWIDPRVTKGEVQRRRLLAKLTHDVFMMQAYCSLRNPTDLVMETEKGAQLGSRLVLRNCSFSKEEREAIAKEETKQTQEEDRISSESSEESYLLGDDLRSAHEKSHLNSDKKFQAKKYFWEQERKDEAETKKAATTSPKREKKEMKHKKGNPNQKFIFCDGFISPMSDPSLALGVVDLDLDNLSGNVEIVLCRKSASDPVQQWELTEDGFISLKCSSKLVLGVAMPAYKFGQDQALGCENSVVTVQNLKQQAHGRANQKWFFDPLLNAIVPFHSSTTDKEITAANHVSVCSHVVVGPERLCQDGFIIDAPSDSPIVVCSSCAKVIRGQYQLIKAPDKMAFVCAMGNARKHGMRQRGSFACLNGKVDLSTYEADTTLQHWLSQLEKLRQETSLRLLTREIQSSTPIQACRVLAMRNGEGRLRPGELIVGTSISGILEQCTQRLSLGTAGRRLYTSDGMHILHMEQLIEWATRAYYEMLKDHPVGLLDGKIEYQRGEPEGNTVAVDNQRHEEGNNSREGTPDHNAAEAGIKVTASDLAKKLRPPSGRRSASKPRSARKQEVQEVPLSVVLRNPIEVWVSCGENFIPPATAEKLYEASLKAQLNRNESNLVLDTEKHKLRHMQGRRFKEMSPRNLIATKLPENPILVEGGWQETTKDEAVKLEKVHRLEEHLVESRPAHQPPKTQGIDFNRELYRQANRKRVLVYLNGESSQKAVYVWGESISEILTDASVRLNMHRRAKVLYNPDGTKVTSFELIERDCLLCATSGDSMKGRPKQSNVAMKANWARTRKQLGPEATEITIKNYLPENDLTGVDPFGPPRLSDGSLALEAPDNF